MMNPTVTPDTKLADILSDHQIGVMCAMRDGAVLAVRVEATDGSTYYELAQKAQKARYVRATTFDYLKRIALIESDDGAYYALSAIATICLAKHEGQMQLVVEPAETEALPEPDGESAEIEAPTSAKPLNLSQAQIKVVQALDKGAVLKTLWRNEKLVTVELVRGDGRKERVNVALYQSLLRKGVLDGGKDEFRLYTEAYPLVQRYL